MAIRVVEDMLDYMTANTGACTMQLRDVAGADGREAMERAGDAVSGIEHPEEVSEPLPSFVSVTEIEGAVAITLDIADAEAYEGLVERVLSVLVDAIEAAGITDALLTHP